MSTTTICAKQGERKYHGNEHDGYFENKGAIVNRLPWELSVDHFVGEEACRFLRNYGDERPFAMMVGFPGPHCPYDPNEEFLDGIDPDKMPPPIPEVEGDAPKVARNVSRATKGPGTASTTPISARTTSARSVPTTQPRSSRSTMRSARSWDAGRGGTADENTVIIFASDHGDHLGDHNLIGKSDFFEGSIHVPLIVHAPGMGEARTYTDLVELGDVTATLLTLAGDTLPDYLDSIPLPDLGI